MAAINQIRAPIGTSRVAPKAVTKTRLQPCVGSLQGIGRTFGVKRAENCWRLHAQGLRVPPTLPREQWSVDQDDVGDEGTSFQQALFNAVNILMGVGLLSIPYSLNEGGWASMGVLGLIWACTNYTGKILIKCQEVNTIRTPGQENLASTLPGGAVGTDALTVVESDNLVLSEKVESEAPAASKPEGGIVGKILNSYEDIGEAAFGEKGRQFITTVLYAELIGTCALFFILEGDHLRMLLEQLMPHKSLPSKEELMALSAGVILPTTWLTDLSSLSFIGTFGILSSFGLTGVILYEFCQKGLEVADTVALHSHSLPGAFGLIAFVFAGHAVFPSIYGSMKEKKEFGRMLDTTYLIVGALCIVMGVAGYSLYGSNTLEEVTLNLPPGSLNVLATILILVSPLTKFALTLEPVARGIENQLGISMNGPDCNLARLNRTGLGLGALFLASQVPYFGQVMSIVGSFLTITVSVLFPALCYLKLYDEDLDTNEKFLNYCVLAIGGFCAVSGTWTAVDELLRQLS